MLLGLVGGWLAEGARTDVLICGMAGARGGWAEAPYAAVPCAPGPASFARAPTRDPRLAVRILPGLRQDTPADVMRGEETQLAGLLAAEPGFEGIACLPGTHTKWAHVSAGEVVSFASYMTGEIFALLAGQLGAAQDAWRRTAGPSPTSCRRSRTGWRGRSGWRRGSSACAPRRCCTASRRSGRARASRAS